MNIEEKVGKDLAESKDSKKTGEKAGWKIAGFGPRYIVIIGLMVFYSVLMVAEPPSDPKALLGILVLLIVVIIMVQTDTGFIRFLRNTRTRLGLVVGLTGLVLGVIALVLSIVVGTVLYLVLGVVYLVMFSPLFLLKIAVRGKKPEYLNPLTLVGNEVVLIMAALFVLSPVPLLSIVAFVLIMVGGYIRGKGVNRETRKKELARIAPPS
jgi:hypothetical protein